MRIGNAASLRFAAAIEQLEERKRGTAVLAHAQKAVPERPASHSRNLEPRGVNLAMQLIQAIDGQLGQMLRIQLGPAVRFRLHGVGEVRAIALHLPRRAVEQQRAHRGAPYVETYNEGV